MPQMPQTPSGLTARKKNVNIVIPNPLVGRFATAQEKE